MIDPEDYQWDSFTLTFYYPVPVTRLFETWTTSAGLESFFIKTSTFSRGDDPVASTDSAAVGDNYRWDFIQDFAVTGTVTDVVPNERFAFTFGQMHCDIKFSESADGSMLHMVQSDIPDTPDGRVMGHLNCRSCWIFFMTNLTSVFSTGVDLRLSDPGRVSSMEVGYLPVEIDNK